MTDATPSQRTTRIRLRAEDVMTKPVIVVRPETAVKDVAALMATHHISGLPVVTAEKELVGIVTEADLLPKEARAADRETGRLPKLRTFGRDAAEARKAGGLVARDLMTSPVITVDVDTPLPAIAALMVQKRINRVPVLRRGQLVGIISRADIVRTFVRSDREIATTVRDALLHELWLDVEQIQIDVGQGVVYLDGEVDRRSEKDLVERWVLTIDGVVGVESKLTFRYDDRKTALGELWPQPRVGGAR